MRIDLKGRRAVVAGGSRGIGRSIALGLAAAGAAVSICARGRAALDATQGEIAAYGGTSHASACDLADKTAIAAYIEAAAGALGGLDILVNNASGLGLGDDEEAWAKGFAVDVMAAVRATHAALPHMERAGGGAILNIASISAYGASARSPAYGAAKAALVSYTQSQALLLAPRRIRVNAVAPGSIEFPGGLWDQRKTTGPQLYNAVLKSIPWGRLGTPEEVANVAVFLVSDAAAWMTGQSLVVDGGQMLT